MKGWLNASLKSTETSDDLQSESYVKMPVSA